MDGRAAFIDRAGKVQFTLDKAFHRVFAFAGGMAEVMSRVQPGGHPKVGHIGRTGKLAIPQIYLSGSAFHEGIASVVACGQSGYIGKTGEPVWGIQLRAASSSPEAAPSPSFITPGLLERITNYPGPLHLRCRPVRAPAIRMERRSGPLRWVRWTGHSPA
jgi:hypothetical protein